jgi:hypothetical protein
MTPVKPNHLAALLKSQAAAIVKSASSSTGEPSTADGVAQVAKATVPTDPGEAELKNQMVPSDGTPGDDTNALVPGENLNPSGTPSADKGAPAELPKMASERVSNVRNALLSVFPGQAKAAAAPVESPVIAAVEVEDPSKSAGAADSGLDLSPDMLVKLAKAVLSTNEGVAFARYTLEKAAGAEHADEMIKAAHAASVSHDETLYIKQAAFNEGMSAAARIHGELSRVVTEAEAGEILKQASLHCTNLDALEHPMLKEAYATGMDDGAALEEGAEAGVAEPEIPMGGEQLTIEDVIALLQEMIAKGEISEEDVAAGLQELQAEGGEDPAAADPAADPAAAPQEPAMA